MRIKRSFITVVLCILLACFMSGAAYAADPESVAPPCDSQGRYLLSNPAHLLYLSENWGKAGAPRDGYYVLTQDIDMQGINDFTPIGKDKENCLLGTLDGQNHAIKNLSINKPGKKYVALFGYVGNDFVEAHIKNLAILDIKVVGTQNVGSFAGVSYGTIENCFVTGFLMDDQGSNAQTVGGIVGKNKEGEIVVGLIKNCYADVTIEGSFNLGGIAGQEDGGGIIEDCFAAGTILAKSPNGAAGGIVGAFNAGQAVIRNVSLMKWIKGEKDTDKIIGQLYDESGEQIKENVSWEGTRIIGNEPEVQPVIWEEVSSAQLTSLAYWKSLGWDFESTWGWYGSESAGRPILKSFPIDWQSNDLDLITPFAIISRPVNKAVADFPTEISARIAGSIDPQTVSLVFGDKPDGRSFLSRIPMTQTSDRTWTASIPPRKGGFVYYYIEVKAGNETLTKPYDIRQSIAVDIDDGTIRGQPEEIVISLGEKQSSIRFNWITVPQVFGTEVWYRRKDSADDSWKKVVGTSYIAAVTKGFNELAIHKAVIENLEPSTQYMYCVGDGGQFMSEFHEFTSPPKDEDTNEFSFIFVSDPQSVSKKDYETLTFILDYALTQVPNPAFIMMAGDITQDGYKATQWKAFFESNLEKWASIPFMPAIGNHDFKADPHYITFNSRFNTPDNGPGGDLGHTVYCFEFGDAFFATLNTEATPSSALEPSIKLQLDWLRDKLAHTTKKWKILQFHEGPYTSNHDPAYICSLLIKDIDEMGIDLVLSGHDHLYLRTTMRGDKKVPIGEGTTYVTGGTCGNKFYEYKDYADRWTEIKADDFDRQIVNFVTISSDHIEFQSMQRTSPKEKTFKLLDSFKIEKSQSEQVMPAPVSIVFPKRGIKVYAEQGEEAA